MYYVKLFFICFAWSFMIIWFRLFWKEQTKFESLRYCLEALVESFYETFDLYITITGIAVFVVLLALLVVFTYNIILK